MNFIKNLFAKLNTEYLIKNYLIGIALGIFFWKVKISGGTIPTKIYIVIASILFPFSKLVFNDLRAVLLRGNIIILPIIIGLPLKFFINSFLFLGTWIFTPLGFLYLYILDKRTKNIEKQNSDF